MSKVRSKFLTFSLKGNQQTVTQNKKVGISNLIPTFNYYLIAQ